MKWFVKLSLLPSLQVKDKYYKDTNTAGPQSRLLDGLTWDEARRIRDDALTKALGPGAVSASALGPTSTSLPASHSTVAAASKAILHRDVRDAALVYDVSFAVTLTRLLTDNITMQSFCCFAIASVIFRR